jgi:DNA adenine methylase Dam
MIISPIFYMGNKKKLINKGLIELFPKNINTLYELFCGSAIVSMNANSVYCEVNDVRKEVTSLIQNFCYFKPTEIVNKVEEIIQKYELPEFSTDTRVWSGNRDFYKEKYNALREDYNKTKDIWLLYTLSIFSNSHMIRFNSKGDFNMPFGNGYFTESVKNSILNNNYDKITYISNVDFREYSSRAFESNDFVYLDPPYFNTTATYNENGGWSENDENDLYKFCEELNSNNIKFAMSNVFENKGIKNNKLIEWVEKNNFNVHTFDKFTYCACGKGNSNAKEVLITNYERN